MHAILHSTTLNFKSFLYVLLFVWSQQRSMIVIYLLSVIAVRIEQIFNTAFTDNGKAVPPLSSLHLVRFTYFMYTRGILFAFRQFTHLMIQRRKRLEYCCEMHAV